MSYRLTSREDSSIGPEPGSYALRDNGDPYTAMHEAHLYESWTTDEDGARSKHEPLLDEKGFVRAVDASRSAIGTCRNQGVWPCAESVGVASEAGTSGPIMVLSPCIIVESPGIWESFSCPTSVLSPITVSLSMAG